MSDYLDLSNINISAQSLLDETTFPILKGLSPLNLRILNTNSRLIDIDQHVETLHEGDQPRELYFIRSGRVAIRKQTKQQRKNIAELSSGDIFGEFAILRNKPRYASVYTLQPSEIVRVSAAAVQQVLEADKAFKERLQQVLSQRILNSFFFNHPIFQTLPDDLRLSFSQDLKMQCIPCDTRIFAQGKPPQGIMLILSGSVEVYHQRQQKEHLLEVRRDNDVLGELATQQGQAAYSAIAASDLDILLLDKEAMNYIREKHPESFKRLEVYIHKRAQLTMQALKES